MNIFSRPSGIHGDPAMMPATVPAAPAASGGADGGRATADGDARTGRQRVDSRWSDVQRLRGLNPGAALFGWLVAVGVGVILTALLAAAGIAIGLEQGVVADVSGSQATLTLAGGALLVAVLLLAYYCGGYVAGRLSRFDGAVQGLAVWVLGAVVTGALAATGAVAGSRYNFLGQLRLPSIPVKGQSLADGGLATLVLIAVATLFAAIIGGAIGHRYHSRVDRALEAAAEPPS